MPRDRTRWVAVGDRWFAVDELGSGPALLLIHGFPLNRTMWHPLMTALPGCRRIAPDLQGFGRSRGPERQYSISAYADDLVGLLDVLGVDAAVACGFSMGGYIAFDLARRHSTRLRGLILVNTRATADGPDAKRARDEMIHLVEREGSAGLVDVMLPKLLAPASLTALPLVVAHVRTMILGNPAVGVTGALRAMRDRRDSTTDLATIDLPTLIIAGGEDQLIPLADAKTMASQIPQARFAAIAQAGHLAPMEQPRATGQVMGRFLEALA